MYDDDGDGDDDDGDDGDDDDDDDGDDDDDDDDDSDLLVVAVCKTMRHRSFTRAKPRTDSINKRSLESVRHGMKW